MPYQRKRTLLQEKKKPEIIKLIPCHTVKSPMITPIKKTMMQMALKNKNPNIIAANAANLIDFVIRSIMFYHSERSFSPAQKDGRNELSI
jgi:ribosome maturation protein Sdo1